MIYAIVVLVLLIIDQGVKYLTLLKIPMDGVYHDFIPGIIDLIRVHNTGIAFSLFDDLNVRVPLVILAVLFAGFVAFLIARRSIRGMLGRWMAVVVIAGALGNAIDRAFFGYVIDMLHFEFFKSFPVFNVADIYVVLGGIAFCLYVIFHKEYNDDELALENGPEPARVVKRVRREMPPPPPLEEISAPERRAALKPGDAKSAGALPPRRTRPDAPPEPRRPAVEDFMNPPESKPQQRQQRPAQDGARQQRPASGAQQRPATGAQQRPAAGAQQRPTAGAQQRPAAGAQQRPASGAQQRPAAGAQQRPTRPPAAQDAPRQRPAAARRPASAPETRSAPRRSAEVDVDIPDFSLEDILAEFSDKD